MSTRLLEPHEDKWDGVQRWVPQSTAANYASCSIRTIRNWRRRGFVKFSRPSGGNVLVDMHSLEAFIEGAAT